MPGLRLDRIYRERLLISSAFEAAGFCAYHLAEITRRPPTSRPVPERLPASVAQRTSRLRFGPCVYGSRWHPSAPLDRRDQHARQPGDGRLEIRRRPRWRHLAPSSGAISPTRRPCDPSSSSPRRSCRDTRRGRSTGSRLLARIIMNAHTVVGRGGTAGRCSAPGSDTRSRIAALSRCGRTKGAHSAGRATAPPGATRPTPYAHS